MNICVVVCAWFCVVLVYLLTVTTFPFGIFVGLFLLRNVCPLAVFLLTLEEN